MNAALPRRARTCAHPLAIALALASALASALSGCASAGLPWQPPAADARATLRVDATEMLALQVHPDGERCGDAFALAPEDDPLRRSDRTLALPAGRALALRLTWPHKYLDECHAILSFTPVADAAYRLGVSPYVDHCEAYVVPVPRSGTAPVEVVHMRPRVLTTSGCTR